MTAVRVKASDFARQRSGMPKFEANHLALLRYCEAAVATIPAALRKDRPVSRAVLHDQPYRPRPWNKVKRPYFVFLQGHFLSALPGAWYWAHAAIIWASILLTNRGIADHDFLLAVHSIRDPVNSDKGLGFMLCGRAPLRSFNVSNSGTTAIGYCMPPRAAAE